MERHRAWVLTCNNPTFDDWQDLCNFLDGAQYYVIGLETGDSGTWHYQGYVYYSNARSFSSLKKKLPRGSFRVAKGSAKQNQDYCSHSESAWVLEDGVMPLNDEPKKSIKLSDMLANGCTKEDIIRDKPAYYIQSKEKIDAFFEAKEVWKPPVFKIIERKDDVMQFMDKFFLGSNWAHLDELHEIEFLGAKDIYVFDCNDKNQIRKWVQYLYPIVYKHGYMYKKVHCDMFIITTHASVIVDLKKQIDPDTDIFSLV